MPKDTIERAIARGSGDQEAENLEETIYEGYGPNGVAIIVETLTDNKNRTVAEVRHAFSKYGGSLGTDGQAPRQEDMVSKEHSISNTQICKRVKFILGSKTDLVPAA